MSTLFYEEGTYDLHKGVGQKTADSCHFSLPIHILQCLFIFKAKEKYFFFDNKRKH
jgi:hypothetical protein